MVKAIELVNIYLKLNINIGIINASIAKENRKKVLNSFLDNTKTQIICNVHILDEAIDIPECDSVYIISESQNIIKIIQRTCRCNRKIGNKVSGIYIWSTKCEQIKNIIINTFNDGNKFVEMSYIIPTEYVQKITKIISREQEIYDKPKNMEIMEVIKNVETIKVIKNIEKLGFSCDNCNRTFKGKQNLLCHVKNNVCGEKIKKVKIYSCSKCEKVFANKKGLIYHTKKDVCTQERIYKCENCDKSYANYSTLWSHNKKCQVVVNSEVKMESKMKQMECVMQSMAKQMDEMRLQLEASIVNNTLA